MEAYVDRLVSEVAGWRDLKVVWDPGNGAAGPVVERLAAAWFHEYLPRPHHQKGPVDMLDGIGPRGV